MTVLEVRSSSEAFHETALSFLKEFAEIDESWLPRTCYADNGCPSKSVFNNSLESHWASSLCILDSQIILYAMKIYIFCNQCDQEGPRKPFVVCFNLTRKEETQIYRCALILAPFFIEQKISLAVQALRQNLALRIDLRKHESTDRENMQHYCQKGPRKPLVASVRWSCRPYVSLCSQTNLV